MEVASVLFLIPSIDKNVVKVGNNKLAYDRFEHFIHDMLGALVKPNGMTNHS